MSEKNVESTADADAVNAAQSEADRVSRRRLLRAGLAAAPVAAAFHSSPVLATGGNCIRPSSYASLSRGGTVLQISKHRATPDKFVCKTASHWSSNSLAIKKINSNEFSPRLANVDKTFGYYLNLNPNSESDRLKKILCAYYLTAHSMSDDSRVLLKRSECATIWSTGRWAPFFNGDPDRGISATAQTAQYLEAMAIGITINQI
jgi:hypothetical protein